MRRWSLCALVAAVLSAGAAEFAEVPYRSQPIDAKVPWYTVRPDLGNLSNRQILPNLTAEQKAKLAQVGFVARPTKEEQLFYIYENNQYRDIPSFVTTDSVLHTYHIFFDYTLRWLEKYPFRATLEELSRKMLDATLAAAEGDHPEEVKEALERNAAYFAVPLELLGEKTDLPPGATKLRDMELQRIGEAKGRAVSLTGDTIIYNQFIPRGHYTRDDESKAFFRAMMWYGLVPMSLKDDAATRQAILITRALTEDAAIKDLWQQLYDPTVFYVGKADDLSYYDYDPLVSEVFGNAGVDALADSSKLQRFREIAEERLPKPRIETEMLVDGEEQVQGRQFRFMGQRYLPDSRIFQELTYPKVGTRENPREMPMALDIPAVFGSERAAQLLDKVYQQPDYENYLAQRQALRDEFAALSEAEWRQNLYHGWLWSLLPLLEPRPEGYPAFMRSLAWRDKSLVNFLGSWTELRHDTLLYGKQSVAEAGGGEEPPPPPGYVEPEPLVYDRLAWLTRFTKAGLEARGLLGGEMERETSTFSITVDVAGSFDRFADLLDTLSRISRKELRGESLNREDLEFIKWYGSELESLMLSAANLVEDPPVLGHWWNIENKTDRNMAIVADVHTARSMALTEAVGHPAEIWVAVPFGGKLIATRGAIFTWYEFHQPADDRLTDEKWQERLASGDAPELAGWAGEVILGPGLSQPTPYGEMPE